MVLLSPTMICRRVCKEQDLSCVIKSVKIVRIKICNLSLFVPFVYYISVYR